MNGHSLNHAYSEQEEGGWWFDVGRFTRCCRTRSTCEALVGTRNIMRPTITTAQRRLYSLASPL